MNIQKITCFTSQFACRFIFYRFSILDTVSATALSMAITVIPIIAVQKYQIEYLGYCGFYYNKAGLITAGILIQILIVFVVGIYSVLASETVVNVNAHYISGLLKITGYVQHTVSKFTFS